MILTSAIANFVAQKAVGTEYGNYNDDKKNLVTNAVTTENVPAGKDQVFNYYRDKDGKIIGSIFEFKNADGTTAGYITVGNCIEKFCPNTKNGQIKSIVTPYYKATDNNNDGKIDKNEIIKPGEDTSREPFSYSA